MAFKYFSLLEELPEDKRNSISGYSLDELIKIESLYGIRIEGEFKEFMQRAGRCDGGLIGDDPLIIYRGSWNVRSHMIFQFKFFNDLQNLRMWEFLKKPFVFSLESETKYYFLMTGSSDDLVFHYDENSEKLSCTGLKFFDYISDLISRYNLLEEVNSNIVCRGDLLRINI